VLKLLLRMPLREEKSTVHDGGHYNHIYYNIVFSTFIAFPLWKQSLWWWPLGVSEQLLTGFEMLPIVLSLRFPYYFLGFIIQTSTNEQRFYVKIVSPSPWFHHQMLRCLIFRFGLFVCIDNCDKQRLQYSWNKAMWYCHLVATNTGYFVDPHTQLPANKLAPTCSIATHAYF